MSRLPLLHVFPHNEKLGSELLITGAAENLTVERRKFPDGESYLRVTADVKGQDCYLLCSLQDPDEKFLPLIFLARTLKEMGASTVHLLAPYLAYMRQDKKFHPGEALTSAVFAAEISRYFDSLTTIDPHLHRYHALSEIYSIPSRVLHSAPLLSRFIRSEIPDPIVIGPDEESLQWVSEVASGADCPSQVLTKTRTGDKNVSVTLPDLSLLKNRTPVLIDDIISSGRTMLAAIDHLKESGCRRIVCLGVHALFGGDAWPMLKTSGAEILTTDCVPHESNTISVAPLLLPILSELPSDRS